MLEDLSKQSQPPHAVAIAHHDVDAADDLATLVQSFADKLTITTVISPRGISNGRNAAAATFGDDVEWVYFPNDTSRLDDDFLERIARHVTPRTTVCAVQLVDREGARNTLPAPGSQLTRRNVWARSSRPPCSDGGGLRSGRKIRSFTGIGRRNSVASWEGTDLLLRLSLLDGFSIEWVPDIAVRAHTEFSHLTPRERRRKIRCYGRGSGYVYRRWNYRAWDRFRHVLGGALVPLRKPAKYGPRDGLALAIGRAEGVFGRVISGDGDSRAILR